jgi:Fe2+ transport system protein FeoA
VEPAAVPTPARAGLTLDALPVGRAARVVSIAGDHDADLALEGLLPGTAIAVASRSPFGGPLVVGVGRARIAVARSVASTVAVSMESLPDTAVEAAG